MWSIRHGLVTPPQGMVRCGENADAVDLEPISVDHISPELALVDPDLAARARASLATPAPPPRRPARPSQEPARAATSHRPYPFWARVTAALWLLVLGILVGGTAVPHAQDRPRVVPADEDAAFCPAPSPGERPSPGP